MNKSFQNFVVLGVRKKFRYLPIVCQSVVGFLAVSPIHTEMFNMTTKCRQASPTLKPIAPFHVPNELLD